MLPSWLCQSFCLFDLLLFFIFVFRDRDCPASASQVQGLKAWVFTTWPIMPILMLYKVQRLSSLSGFMSEFDILLLCIRYNSFSRSLHWTIQILLLWSLVFCAILIRKQCVTINFCHHFWVYFPPVHLFNIKRLIPIS